MKILIVKTSALGDVVHALPVLEYIKKADPDAIIDWLVEAPFAPLLEIHPAIRRIHRVDTRAWRRRPEKAWSGFRRLQSSVRREAYDAALDLQGNAKSGLFTLLSGAPRRYGFALDGAREWPNLLATNRRVFLTDGDYHITDRSLRIARKAFPNEGHRAGGALFLPDADPVLKKQVQTDFHRLGIGDKRRVLLHAGTTWKTKRWPLNHWKRLAVRLKEHEDARLVLTWGNKEELAAAQAVREAAGSGAVVWPRVPLPGLMALLSQVHVVVGGDTGPVHIAAALKTPTVSFYRATEACRNGPRGEAHICLQSPLSCSPCLRKACDRDRECAESIQVGDAAAAVSRLLKHAGQR